ncbi:MAG: IspD/TarI family cytidylyltransferase [Acetivibrionales bacterium]|jgi:2-C-methyl-D-erythritol 4-phosphate cytidylyltransferase
MNIAVIFAGGTGVRMNSNTKPKQFLELHGKSILLHTLEHFEFHPEIDFIVVACLESWIDVFKNELYRFGIKKVKWIVPGGETVQHSVYNALKKIEDNIKIADDDIVLLHDGVRPLINQQLISQNIESVKKYGSGITVAYQYETVATINRDGFLNQVIDRNIVRIAKAPQSFHLKDVIEAHKKAISENKRNFIDTASLMSNYGYKLRQVIGSANNLKVTTATDFYMFKAMLDARETSQIFGYNENDG